VYTYRNPFRLTEASFWEKIKDLPHLCVSQTLVQGLTRKYKRTSFSVIDTIERFIEYHFQSWVANPENDIAQFLMLSEEIRKLEDGELRTSFMFNRRELVDAIRFLTELRIDPAKFDQNVLSKEQKVLLELYDKVRTTGPWQLKDPIYSVGETFIRLLERELEQVQKRLEQNHFSNELVRQKEHLIDIRKKLAKINAVVFHGVHQFTPMILKCIHHLEEQGIEVIFLINLVEDYERIYETWKTVYQWASPVYEADSGPYSRDYFENDLGRAIGLILKGESAPEDFRNVRFLKFDNLTTITDKVAFVYKRAKTTIKGEKIEGALGRMQEQFYAVNNNSINALLKAYFPEQFGEKHFLSYPVGQFILSIYNMWDEKEQRLKLNENLLKECLAVNFFNLPGQPNPIEIYNKIKLYFKDVETIEDYFKRIDQLMETIEEIDEAEDGSWLKDLQQFSFFNVSREELQYFKQVLNDLKKITEQLFFGHEHGYLNYRDHYKKLIDYIYQKTAHSQNTTPEELELVNSLKEQFENIHNLEIKGSIEDLKETIHYYLNRVNSDDSANWICRNFEQLDGGVLLSATRGAKDHTYHLTMLSDQKMKVKVNDLLPWPLTEEFFQAYQEKVKDLETVLTSKREYSNFLRYSLFYACYYLKNKIVLSYIEKSEGEKDTPYFLLEMLGLEPEEFDPREIYAFPTRDLTYKERFKNEIGLRTFSDVEVQTYAICDYRYWLDHVIEKNSYYVNEFHCKYYYRAILLKRVWTKYQGRANLDLQRIIHDENQELRKYFPFWNNLDFYDLQVWVERDLNDQLEDGRLKSLKNPDNEYYLNLRTNFLVAKLENEDGGEQLLKPLFRVMRTEYRKRVENQIMQDLDNNIPFLEKEVHPEICNFCKQREVCLHHFREVVANE
jgi:hypothetical protein